MSYSKLSLYLLSLCFLFGNILTTVLFAQTDSSKTKYGLTSEQYQFVLKETVQGGKLDFEPQMGDKFLVLIDSIAYNKHSGALVFWGSAMKKLGVRTADEAVSLYEEVSTTTLREPQRKAIRNGFNRKSQ
jgi:hypothetical protein